MNRLHSYIGDCTPGDDGTNEVGWMGGEADGADDDYGEHLPIRAP